MPDGWTPPAPKGEVLAKPAVVDKNWKQMLADYRFYLMIIVFTIFATGA